MTRGYRPRPKPEHLLWVVIVAVLVVAVAAVLKVKPALAPAPHLASDLYPLYPGIAWGIEVPMKFSGASAQGTLSLSGYSIRSITAKNLTNIAALTTPFETYYRQKLLAAGWQEDKYLEAGGPGASQMGYVKGGDYAVIGYTTVFHSNVAGPNSPVACPCDTTFTIWSSSSGNH